MNLDVTLVAGTRGMEHFAQLSGALVGVKAEAEAAGDSLDDVKLKSGGTSESVKVLGASTVDLKGRMQEAKARAEEFRGSLQAMGLSGKQLDTELKNVSDTIAKKLVFGDLSQAARDAGESMRVVGPALRSVAADMVDGQNKSGGFRQALSSIGTAAASAGSSIPIFSSLIGTAIAAAIAFGPLIIALGTTTILLGVFTVALTGAVAVVGLLVGGIALMGGGMVALAAATGNLGDVSGKAAASQQELAVAGDKVQAAHLKVVVAQNNLNAATKAHGANSLQAAQAQSALAQATDAHSAAQGKLNDLQEQGKGPLADLLAKAKGLASTLGEAVTPAAKEFVGVLSSLVPFAESAILPVVAGFTALMPAITPFATTIGKTLITTFQGLGLAFNDFASEALKVAPQFEGLFSAMAGVGVIAIRGLLTNLLQLSSWFFTNLPTLGPIIQQVFGALGNLVQGAALAMAKLALDVAAHWPEIIRTFENAKGTLQAVEPELRKLGDAGQFVLEHLSGIAPVVLAVVTALAALKVVTMAVTFVTEVWAAVQTVATVATALWTVAQWALNVALSANPIGIVIVVIAALAAGIIWAYQNVGWFHDAVDGAWGAIKAFGGWIKDTLGPILSSLGEWIGAAASKMGSLIEKASHLPGVSALFSGASSGAALEMRAAGGPVRSGRTYLVGERGPEMLVMGSSGGYVYPNSRSGGGGSPGQQQVDMAGTNALLENQNGLLGALLEDQNMLLSEILAALQPRATFSTKAYNP